MPEENQSTKPVGNHASAIISGINESTFVTEKNNKDQEQLKQKQQQQRQQKHAADQEKLLSDSSDITKQNDLTLASIKESNGESYQDAVVESPTSTPSKSSPTKKKRRRRGPKKQQQQSQQEAESEPKQMHQMDENEHVPTSAQQEQDSGTPEPNSGPSSESQEPKSSDTNAQQKKQPDSRSSPTAGQMDSTNESASKQNDNDPSTVPAQPISLESQPLEAGNESGNSSNLNNGPSPDQGPAKRLEPGSASDSSRRGRQRENREVREQLKVRNAQFRELAERFKQQITRTRDLESSLVSTTRTCAQFEKLLQQELTNRARLEAENEGLNQTLMRLRNQMNVLEKEKSANSELIRVLNATLMERETEVSILKLKMTRIQTSASSASHANMAQFNPPSNSSLAKRDPCKAFTMAGRSNSEFSRNSKVRSTMMADAASTRSSTSQLQQFSDRDASVWAQVPEDLTPSKRPILLERNNGIYGDDGTSSPLRSNQSSTPILRDRRYRTLPRSMKNPIQSQQQQPMNQEENNLNPIGNINHQSPMHATPSSKQQATLPSTPVGATKCIVTNLDESNNTSQSSGANKSSPEVTSLAESKTPHHSNISGLPVVTNKKSDATSAPNSADRPSHSKESSSTDKHSDNLHQNSTSSQSSATSQQLESFVLEKTKPPPHMPQKSPSTPVKISAGFKKIFGKFRRSDSSGEQQSQSKTDLKSPDPPLTPTTSAFQRGATRSTMMVGPSSTSNLRAQMSPQKTIEFKTDKPFAEWDTDMLVDWLTVIGLSMYASQCRRWVKCGAHIMNATPAEVDKGLGITNHLHRKKLRLAISELNGDCDKITKAAAKLDYLWVARWLDDIGLPQHKEAFINARVDGRVLNYLTVEDLVSLGVRSILHHASIRCGIKVLRSINFELQLLKRRATAEEIEQMNTMRQNIDEQIDSSLNNKSATGSTSGGQQVDGLNSEETEVPLWTCHRVMEWLRMIDFAEFAPNLRGSGVHGGLIMFEDGFNIDTMSTLLSIPSSRTLLRRHLSTFFENLVGPDLARRKKQYKEMSSNLQLNPASEIKTPKKSPLLFGFGKLKSSKVGQDGMDEYLCPMYPVEPQIVKSPGRRPEVPHREPSSNLPIIPESINV